MAVRLYDENTLDGYKDIMLNRLRNELVRDWYVKYPTRRSRFRPHGRTALHAIINEQRLSNDMIGVALQKGEDPNIQEKNYPSNTLLHSVIDDGALAEHSPSQAINRVLAIIRAKAKLSIKNDDGQTPLELCVWKALTKSRWRSEIGSMGVLEEIADILLRKGGTLVIPTAADNHSDNLLAALLCSIYFGVTVGHLDEIEGLQGMINILARYTDIKGLIGTVKGLLGDRESSLAELTKAVITFAQASNIKVKPQVIDYLSSLFSMDLINQVDLTDIFGLIKERQRFAVQQWCEKNPTVRVTKDGLTPLLYLVKDVASHKSSPSIIDDAFIIRYLIQRPGEDVNVKDAHGFPILSLLFQVMNNFFRADSATCTEIGKKQIDWTLRDSGGNTPLHYAARFLSRHSASTIFRLQEQGVRKAINIQNNKGMTPLDSVNPDDREGRYTMGGILQQYGAESGFEECYYIDYRSE